MLGGPKTGLNFSISLVNIMGPNEMKGSTPYFQLDNRPVTGQWIKFHRVQNYVHEPGSLLQ